MLSFGRSAVADLLNITAGWLELGDDPLLVYSLAAAALLAFVSLVSAVGRLDFAALLRPRALVALCCAVLLAFAGVALAELALTDPELEGLALGAARFPLYVVALAFGPTVGLAAGALFAAATAVGPFPGWSEAILCLELLVLGWLAIYPSPRAVRWAGPLDALLAHVFTAGTAGVAFLAWRDGSVSLAALLAGRKTQIKGVLRDQSLIAGVGNAYSDEILHRARLSPLAQTRSLVSWEMAQLHEATVSVLEEWIEKLRLEVGDGFPTRVTAFRAGMAVHGRYGQPCPSCGTAVQRIRYAENEADYCPRCQTGGRLLADRALSRLLKADWPRTIDELEVRQGTKPKS